MRCSPSASTRPSSRTTSRTLDGPTEEELNILRTELDPRGQNTGERSAWIVYDGAALHPRRTR